MTLPSPLVVGLAPPLWDRPQLEEGYAALHAEVARLDGLVTVAQTTTAESIHARQVLANRIRSADNYLLTVPDDVDMDSLRRDLRALLVGGMQ